MSMSRSTSMSTMIDRFGSQLSTINFPTPHERYD